MSIEVCPSCTCRFAVGLLRCPQCGAVAPLFADQVQDEHGPELVQFTGNEETTTMPKITVAGGPSNAAALPGEVGYIPPEGSEDVSAGTNSSTFASKPEPNSSVTPTSSDPQPPAPTTESPSSPDPQASPASGGAASTAGSGPATGSGQSPRRASSTASPKDPAPTAAEG